MKESDRIDLYNDLSDYEQELREIVFPNMSREINIIHRAVQYVRGNQARWITKNAVPVFNDDKTIAYYSSCTCSSCSFASGLSTYRFCPSCASRMLK